MTNQTPIEKYDDLDKAIDATFKCNCILCQEKNHEFTTTPDCLKSFFKSYIAKLITSMEEEMEKGKLHTPNGCSCGVDDCMGQCDNMWNAATDADIEIISKVKKALQ